MINFINDKFFHLSIIGIEELFQINVNPLIFPFSFKSEIYKITVYIQDRHSSDNFFE